MAQLVERWTRDPKTRGSNPVRRTSKQFCEGFPESKCCADSLLVCPTPGCIITHKNDHIRTLTMLWSMSEFEGLWKHKKTQHALYNWVAWLSAAGFPWGKRTYFPVRNKGENKMKQNCVDIYISLFWALWKVKRKAVKCIGNWKLT